MRWLFKAGFALLLWEQDREPQSSPGMGNCWGKGTGDNPGEQGEELGGCRSPVKSAEGASPSTRLEIKWRKCCIWSENAAVIVYMKVS